MTQGPLRPEDLRLATQRIGKNIEGSRDKLGNQTNPMMFAKPEDGLDHHIECRRMGAPLLPQVGESSGVVGKKGH